MAEKTCREFEENLDALLTGWYQEEDCTAERAAILNAYATAEQEVEALRKQLIHPTTGRTWEWHWRDLVESYIDDTSEETLNENAVAKLQVEVERLRAALATAETEILWWVDEHGCCRGHEEAALTEIRDELRRKGNS